MKSKSRWIVCLLVVVLFAILIGRLVWTSWGTVTGWGHIKNSGKHAAYGWMTSETSVLSSSDPDVQADFWLKEIDRAIEKNPNSATIAMGCALILDSYGTISMSSFLQQQSPIEGYPGLKTIGVDRESLDDVYSRFVKRTNDRCLELAKRATDLEPENNNWWRLRSLLLFPEGFYHNHDAARTENWQRILEEASKHDPDNALYEYLATYRLWRNNTNYDFDTRDEFDDWTVLVKDRQKMDLGLKHFQDGLKKKFLDFGEVGLSGMEAALKEMSVSPIDHRKVINNQLVSLRSSLYFSYNKRSRYEILTFHRQKGNLEKAIEAIDQLRRYDDQQRTINNVVVRNDLDYFRLIIYFEDYWKLEEKNPQLLTDEQKANCKRLHSENQTSLEILNWIAERKESNEESTKNKSGQVLSVLGSASQSFAGSIVAFYGLVLGSIFLIIGAILRKWSKPDETIIRVGPFRHLAIWIFAIFLSGSVTFYLSADEQIFDSGAGKTIWIAMFIALTSLAIVEFVRTAITADRYTRTASHRSVFNILWLLILIAVVWQTMVFLSGQGAFIHRQFRQNLFLWIAGLVLLFFASHFLIKYMSWKSRCANKAKKGGNLLLGFLMTIPLTIYLAPLGLWVIDITASKASARQQDWLFLNEPLNQVLQNTFQHQSNPIMIFFYWNALYGAQIFLLLVLFFVGASVFWRRLRLLDSTSASEKPTPKTPLWRPMFRAMGATSLGLGLIGLVAWLLIEPTAIELTENEHQMVIQYHHHPEKGWVKLAALADEIKADEELMKQLREKAEKNIEERREEIRKKIEKAKKKAKKKLGNGS